MNFFELALSKNDLVAAPMAGVSIPPFRMLLRDYFDGLIYTEMVSVEGIKRNNPMSTEYLKSMDNGPTVAQFFGGNAESYPEAAKVAERFNIAAFDINMGCPVKKVIKAGGGCALLQDLSNVERIIRSLRHGTDKPFSVKIRVGWDDSKYVYNDILDIAEIEGADALILHGRTRNQMFGGNINYDAIAEIAQRAKIPIIGNGNVETYDSYIRMKETGVKGVMIGRAMMHSPWIFKSIKEKRETSSYLKPYQLYDLLIKFYNYMLDYSKNNEKLMYHYNNIIKKFAVWFSKGLEDAAQFRVEVFRTSDMQSFIKLLDYFKQIS